MSDQDRDEVQYAVQWNDGDIEYCADGAAADRALSFGGGHGVIVRRVVHTSYGEWQAAR